MNSWKKLILYYNCPNERRTVTSKRFLARESDHGKLPIRPAITGSVVVVETINGETYKSMQRNSAFPSLSLSISISISTFISVSSSLFLLFFLFLLLLLLIDDRKRLSQRSLPV